MVTALWAMPRYASALVGLAIIIALYRSKSSISVDDFQLLKW